MDESEEISRRDAIAGLALLGVLFVGLLGSTAYRIMNAGPTRPTGRPAMAGTPNASRLDASVGFGEDEAVNAHGVHRDPAFSPATFQVAPSNGPQFIAPADRQSARGLGGAN